MQFTTVYMKAPFPYVVCVRGMGNLVEHWFGLLFGVHAVNNTDAESQDRCRIPASHSSIVSKMEVSCSARCNSDECASGRGRLRITVDAADLAKDIEID